MFTIHSLSEQQKSMLRAMDTITSKDVKRLMQFFPSVKIKKVRLGLFWIVNQYLPELKNTMLGQYEGRDVFYAVEKKKFSLFSKAERQIFICSPEFDYIFAAPLKGVRFSKVGKKDKELFLLSEKLDPRKIYETKAYDRNHICFLQKICLYREFAVKKAKLVAVTDIAVHHLRWTNPDPWVNEHFTVKDANEPMFYLRNAPRALSAINVAYPKRSPLYGYHIEE